MSGVWDAVRPELDTRPPWDIRLPATSYIVCATQRSGSGLLCRGLASTGLAGIPAEYFNTNQRSPLSERWRTGTDLRAYARELRARRTSKAGAFGIKLHWDQMEHLCGEVIGRTPSEADLDRSLELLDELFPASTYVYIRRADVDRQAVSLWTALHTGVWTSRVGDPVHPQPSVPYSFEEIERCRELVVRGDRHWARMFERRGLQPVTVVYEELVERYPETIASVLEHIAGRYFEAAAIPPPDSRRQSDRHSDELHDLFTRERARRAERRTTKASRLRAALRST